ncbi:amino acid adenylation domain-containing protein, partial [Nonomuraea sp. NPDC002799]
EHDQWPLGPDLHATWEPIDTGTAKFDLTFSVLAAGHRMWLELEYATDLYDPGTISRFADQWLTLLDRALTNPASPLISISSDLGGENASAPAAALIGAVAPSLYVEPRSETERVLAGIWAESLGVDRVGATDRFFAVGGHSILAVQVVARVREVFGVELGLDDLFQAPTLADSAARIDAAERGSGGVALVAREPDAPLVLSSGQERLWFLDQWRPGSAAYNVPIVLRLNGSVDNDRLRTAVETIVRRHTVLRIGLAVSDGRPLPVPGDPGVPWQQADARADGEAGAWWQVRAGLSEPFDLSRGRLLRAGLVRYAADGWLLWLSVHHSACDAWSVGVILDELTTAYAGGDLPALPVSYADYAAWQRRSVDGPALAAGVEWWREHLAGAPALTGLPADRARPAAGSWAGATHRQAIDPALAERISTFAAANSYTVFQVLFTTFAIVLSRWSGQNDTVIGTPVAGRSRPELDGLVGFFVNTLPLRSHLDEQAGFTEALAAAKTAALQAQTHADIPFEALVEALAPERELTHSPLVQTVFGLFHLQHDQWTLGSDLHAEWEPADTGTAKFDLTFSVLSTDRRMWLELEYATDLFEPDTVRRFAQHWLTLLDRALTSPTVPLADLSSLPVDEQRQLRRWSNDRPAPAPVHRTVDDLVAEQARRSPDAVAVVSGKVRLTYAELMDRAEALAVELGRLGVGRGDAVGLCCDRSADLVVGMLGILRAGGAYVPLDPDYPADRLAFMLDDSDVRLVLGHRHLLAALPAGERLAVPIEEIPETAERLARPAASGDDLAYIIYTSGSTGRPKGVMAPHRGVVRLVRDTDYVRLSPQTVIPQLGQASFDAITFEVWGPLLNGGRVVIVPSNIVLSPAKLASLLRTEGVTTVFITTALFNATITEQPDAFATVDQLYFGGEPLNTSKVAGALATGGPAELHNIYGPTETTTFATYMPMLVEPSSTGLIGRPISNTHAWVLDPQGRPSPIGVPGELYLGGLGVALGYWNRPELTAERFLPDPFSSVPGQRLYRTGDLARRLPDGTLEFLGRNDDQVKIRGFRIELGEIETVLAAHPGVTACLVTAHRPDDGPTQLVAYLQPGDATVTTDHIRGHLAEHLPKYMVPAIIIMLDDLPLNPNGKIDRHRLPAPDVARGPAPPTPPRSPLEQLIAGIWADVLDRPGISIHDNFFTLGGHSLAAVKVTSRLERVLPAEVPIGRLFEHATVASLARFLEDSTTRPEQLSQIASIVLTVNALTPAEIRNLLEQREDDVS